MRIAKTFLALIVGTAAVAALGAGAAQAAVERISCPVDRARGEVVTMLPPGWWSTPMDFALQSTRVERIRGRTVLTCDYGPAGLLRRDASSNDCRATRTGFRCNVVRVVPVPVPLPIPIPAPAPAPGGGGVVRSGEARIAPGASFDFDIGAPGGAGADIQVNGVQSISGLNGARVAGGFGSNRPGLDGCRGARYQASWPLPDPDRGYGAAFCVRTSEGRIAEFVIRDFAGGLRIAYTTWNP